MSFSVRQSLRFSRFASGGRSPSSWILSLGLTRVRRDAHRVGFANSSAALGASAG
jgi:hypothetical protein